MWATAKEVSSKKLNTLNYGVVKVSISVMLQKTVIPGAGHCKLNSFRQQFKNFPTFCFCICGSDSHPWTIIPTHLNARTTAVRNNKSGDGGKVPARTIWFKPYFFRERKQASSRFGWRSYGMFYHKLLHSFCGRMESVLVDGQVRGSPVWWRNIVMKLRHWWLWGCSWNVTNSLQYSRTTCTDSNVFTFPN